MAGGGGGGGCAGSLNASSLDEIWRPKRHTDRSPNSLRGDSWASVPNGESGTRARGSAEMAKEAAEKMKTDWRGRSGMDG